MSQVITNAFEQYWQSSLAAEQPVVLDEFILADIPNLDITAPIDPDTILPPESQIVHRQSVDQRGRINNNAVAYTIVMDTTVGDFSFNAMYLRNKQNGVIGMIVYKGRETKLKTDQTTGQTGNSLVKSMLMGYDQAAEATLTNVDAGTWQIDYAARLRGMDEDIRQLQADLYGHHTFVGDGFKVVETDGAFQVTPGVAIVGGLRVELKQPEVIYPGTKPIGVWVDVHRAGSLLSEHQNHFTLITSVTDLTDHVDGSGYQHFVAKLGSVLADTIDDCRGSGGVLEDVRDQSDSLKDDLMSGPINEREGRFVLRDVVSVMDFGAIGDGINDDSAAFQAAADYLNSRVALGTVIVPDRQFAIGREVYLGKVNLKGGGMSRAGKGCVVPVAGYDGVIFNWDGARISDLTIKGDEKKGCAVWMDSGYNRVIKDCDISGFYYGIYVDGITVNFEVGDATFHTNYYAFFCKDKESKQSTTTYFRNVMFQWCENGVWFERDLFGSSFSDVIMEHIKGAAFRASWWGGCKWDTIWWEGRQIDGNSGPCISVGIASGYEDCIAVNLYPRAPWVNNISPNTVDASNALTGFGGVVVDSNAVRVRNRYGSSLNILDRGLHFDIDAWLQGKDRRTLKLSTRDAAPESGYVSDISVSPGLGGSLIVESGNQLTGAAPPLLMQINGNDVSGNRRYLRVENTSRRIGVRASHKVHYESVNEVKVLDWLAHYVFDASKQSSMLGGARFSVQSIGVVRLEIPVGSDGVLTSDEFRSPAIQVSGVMGSDFMVCKTEVLDSYPSGWSSYRVCKGFVFKFVNLNGEPVTPERFTASITSTVN